MISFHSLEDRIVKQFFREPRRGCICPPDFPVCACGREPELRRCEPQGDSPEPAGAGCQPARGVGPAARGGEGVVMAAGRRAAASGSGTARAPATRPKPKPARSGRASAALASGVVWIGGGRRAARGRRRAQRRRAPAEHQARPARPGAAGSAPTTRSSRPSSRAGGRGRIAGARAQGGSGLAPATRGSNDLRRPGPQGDRGWPTGGSGSLLAFFASRSRRSSLRACWLQGVRARELRAPGRAASTTRRSRCPPAGRDLRPQGVQLAIGEEATTVYANPSQIVNAQRRSRCGREGARARPEHDYRQLRDSTSFVYVAAQGRPGAGGAL